MPLEAQKRAMVTEYDALHYLNDPGHAGAILNQFKGAALDLIVKLNDDPALAAFQIRDQLPALYGYLHDLNRWCYAVIEAPPDGMPESGARKCL